MKIEIGALLAAIVIASPANAQWIYHSNESAFGDPTLHIALTGKGKYGLGVRCRAGVVDVAYITPDTSFTAETYEVANLTNPKLRIRVDKNAIMDLNATLEDSEGTASVLAEIDLELVEEIRDAKSSVAVVVQLLGENYHENTFNVQGSTKAIEQLMSACVVDGD